MPTEYRDLSSFFYPKSVAVIGASRNPQKLGAIVLKSIIESQYKGEIYPVNPQAETVNNKKSYNSVEMLPQQPELAIIAIPAQYVIETLHQLGEKGTQNVVVLSAGFKEIGDDGAALEKNLISTANKYQMNLLGPNCLGFINNLTPINATFAEDVKESGNLRFITQSGAIAASLLDWSNTTTLGISEFVTLGNKATLNENHILKYFHQQSQNTLIQHSQEGLSSLSPIGLYLESISDGPEFLRLLQEITKKDPILILKPGKSQAAAKAMQSHTGAIAGADSVLDEVIKQAGAIRCETLEDFFDYSRAFAWEDLPQGPKVAVISNAGGPAVISADAVVKEGLEFTHFDEATKNKLYESLPRSASIVNPVDVLGDALADRFAESADIVLQNEDVDALIVILTPQIITQIERTAESVGKLSAKHKKPIFCSFIGGSSVAEGENILNRCKIPSFRFPERAIAAVGAMWKFKKRLLELADTPVQRITADQTQDLSTIKATEVSRDSYKNPIMSIVQKAILEGQTTLNNVDVDTILKTVGIKTPPTKNAQNLEDAKNFAQEFGWPVVLKFSSPGLLHKKDVGGVETAIMNETLLEEAWHRLERKLEQLNQTNSELAKQIQFQVQKEVLHGIEVIVGVKTDPTFGPVLLFGAGGSYAELIADRNIHLLPIDIPHAKKLVEKSKVYKLLQKNENEPEYPLDKLYELLVQVGKLASLIPEASDIEINPAIVTLNDVWAVDGKILMKENLNNQNKQSGASTPDGTAASAKATGGSPQIKPKAPQLIAGKCTHHSVLATQFNYFEIETPEPFDFKPGQYVSVKVAPTAVRAYSISTRNSPTNFSLLVDTRPGGPGSQFFEKLQVGDTVPFLGPFGQFTLKLDDDVEHLLFLGTGSGLSALRCMVDSALLEQNCTKPLTLYFGLTYEKEIFWKEHFDELSQKYSNFNYEIVICEPTENWHGACGFNTTLLDNKFPDTSKAAGYLCGHPAMIKSATEILLKNGTPQEKIYSERFL